MPTFRHLARTRHTEGHALIQDLRLLIPDEQLASLLGIRTDGLGFKRQPLPVCRAALYLHLLAFPHGSKLTVFDLLTSCRYTRRTPQAAGRRAGSESK